MSADALRLREAALEWIQRSANGELTDLSWVDIDIDPERAPFRQTSEAPTFSHLPYGAFLPPPMVEAAQEASEEGVATALEALLLLFARPEWLIHTRRHLWGPLSPVPALLATLVETYGVSAELHREDPARLARLAALIPAWHPHRGRLTHVLQLLEDALEDAPEAEITAGDQGDSFPPVTEAFACRSAAWWRRRQEEGATPGYRIASGVVQFQPVSGPGFRTIQEDVLVTWSLNRPLPRSVFRLLPVWQDLRLVVEEGA